MTRFDLSGFLSPTHEPPSFLIPVFSRMGSNFGYVQELDQESKVLWFQPVQPELFHTVAVVPPSLSLTRGSDGLLAYWIRDGSVAIGTHAQLAAKLKSVPTNEPFSALELASLLQDEVAEEIAASKISEILGEAAVARRWRARRLRALEAARRSLRAHGSRHVAAMPGPEHPDASQWWLSPEREGWADSWCREWYESTERAHLEEVALWWIEHPASNPIDQARLLGTLLREGSGPQVDVISMRWLERSDLSLPGWVEVWAIAYRKLLAHRQKLAVLGTSYLNDNIDRMDYATMTSPGWPMIWRMLWDQPYIRRDLEAVADRAIGQQNASSEMVRLVYFKVLDERQTVDPKLLDHVILSIRAWLPKHLGNTKTWVKAYLRMWDYYEPREDFFEIGINWLGGFGASMNGWLDIWLKLYEVSDKNQMISLAIAWLRRARWDLTSWPKVFDSVASAGGEEIKDELREIGRDWLAWGGSRRKRDLIKYSMHMHKIDER